MLRVMVIQMTICMKVSELYSRDQCTSLDVSYSSTEKIRLQGELRNEESPAQGQLQGPVSAHSCSFTQPTLQDPWVVALLVLISVTTGCVVHWLLKEVTDM